MKPVSNDGIIDAIPEDEPGSWRTPNGQRIMGEIFEHIVRDVNSPPPNNNSSQSGYADSRHNLGSYDDVCYDTHDIDADSFMGRIMTALKHRLGETGHFLFIGSTPKGWFGVFFLPRRAIMIFLFALFLMFVTIYNFPAIWEILFSIFTPA
ncbi:MAG: hypothetical protein JXJ20_10610 [Anaerolineae bacterium]|nr:hypothetical protein [Anaerolineae bacterium]